MAATDGIGKKTPLRPSKRLGQHFLRDRAVIQRILTASRLDTSDRVLEIGPGLGALTFSLANMVGHVVAVEKDSRLTAVLADRLLREGVGNVTLLNEDILKFDFGRLEPVCGRRIKVIGNLPYNISSPVLEKLVENRNLVRRAVLMFQFELARRLTASPGSRDYGAMSVSIQYHARISPLLEVSKEAFYPRPKVGSMVLDLDFERPHPRRAEDESQFRRVVRGAFAHKRKTLLNSLSAAFPAWGKDALLVAMKECAIDPRKRAESLDIDDFLRLSAALAPDPPPDF